MVAQEIEQRLRTEFGIPPSISMQWAIIVETNNGESLWLPGMILDGGRLTLDICRRAFITESKVLGISREIRPSECESGDDEVILRSDWDKEVRLSLQELDDICFNKYFKWELLERAKNENII
ncbi:MAG: hypothetical protein J6031_00085 [Bacteroidales bacterium]|nr:hypothetical protein [Bacteroidales bacterium]